MSSAARGPPVRILNGLHAPVRQYKTGLAHRQVHCPSPLIPHAARFSRPPQTRTQSSLAVTLDPQRPKYRNVHEILADRIPPEDHSRAVSLTALPGCVNDDDVREFFEEEGFKVQQVIMVFEPMTAHNTGRAEVVLESEDAAKAAVRQLNEAVLFDRKVPVRPYVCIQAPSKRPATIYWGWTASKDPTQRNAKVREPRLRPPKDIFRPIREGRRVGIDMPKDACQRIAELYPLFHNYNVDAAGRFLLYQRKDGSLRTAVMIDFTTREEAETAVQVYNRSIFRGIRLLVNKYQIPLKYLGGSWDGTRKGGHYSGRDQGNAVGTNFEQTQEEVLARAILGSRDRKRWVSSHTY